MTAEAVVIESWYAGKMTIKRSAVKAVIPTGHDAGGPLAYEGPTENGWAFGNTRKARGALGAEGKKKAQGQFKFRAGTLESTGNGALAGREVDFPLMAAVEFDVHWGAEAPLAFNLNLFSDNFKSANLCRAYSLRVNEKGASLTRRQVEDDEPFGEPLEGKAKVDLSRTGGHARFSLRVNREKQIFTLLINGRPVARWKDAGRFAGAGNGLTFVARTPEPLKISRLRIRDWDGRLPAVLDQAAPPPKQDTLRMPNTDIIKGEVVSAANGTLKMKTGFGEVDLPINRIASIQLANPAAPPVKPAGHWVRAKLKGQGALVFQLKSWAAGKLSVEHPDFGSATLDGRVIDSVTFNLQAKRPTKPERKLTKKDRRKLEQLREK